MNDAVRHYDELLAAHYSWMVGVPFEEKVAEQKALLEELGFAAGQHGRAIDLGAGPGYQSAALAELGYSPVIAIDTSKALLDELSSQKGTRAIETLYGDLRHLSRYTPGESAEAIVCMGDVLTHLERHDDVATLLKDSFTALKPGGRLVLTFRDLSQELAGLDRFIPVQSDADRVMVCVLEYEPRTVLVHDLIHTRNGSGWRLDKSCYRKLRVAPKDVARQLEMLGFEITFDGAKARMWAISARKPL
ncbi:MAG TPA: class I SAM-dependent methyltransferase [Rhizomicrobium sp.]|jgi:SAM-dependent methyltransferase|nr:class I SAM-dependent methyltransferase [Rhizomicrobium sp.]